MPTRPSTELPGADQRLGPYRLVRPVSSGGMARVYEGRLDSLAGVSTRVAVKVIHPEYAEDGNFQELFIAEARMSARLEHQNVVRVQQFNREGNLYYLVMEFIDGVTFRRLISLARRSRITLSPALVAELGRQAAEGLHYAHSLLTEDGRPAGLVHRDVKPSNLMLTSQGVVKVLDFGISAAQGSENASDGPAVKGTWGYMAPEQADGQGAGPAADVFGLGAVLYELATGEVLVEDKEHARIRERLAEDEAARKAAALAGPWRELGSLLVRALQRDPAARFPSAAAFGRALAALSPDHVATQEQLVRLAADAARTEPAGTAADRPRTASTLAQPSQSGLPVTFGDDRGPRPTTSTGRTRRTTSSQTRNSVALLVVMLAALALLLVLALALPSVRLPWRAPEEPPFPAEPGEVELTTNPAPAPTEVPPAATVPNPAAVPPATPAAVPPATPAAAPPAAATTAPAPGKAAPAKATSTKAAPSATKGLLTVSSVPRAQVLLDGTYVDYTPYFRQQVATGSHTVVLLTDDGRRKSFKVEVRAGEEARKVWLFDEERWGD